MEYLDQSHRSVRTCATSFFFFQAEDGIRDLIVTGVQTCALPIWSPRFHPHFPSLRTTSCRHRAGMLQSVSLSRDEDGVTRGPACLVPWLRVPWSDRKSVV